MTEKKQILKSASIITLVTLASRVLGYVRDQRITLLLGTSPAADSFVLAYRIPNLLRRLVGEGAMTACFIPVFTRYLNDKPEEEVWEFANRLFWTLAFILAILTILGTILSPSLIRLFTLLGSDPKHWELAIELNRIVFPYIFFIGLAALAMAILNCFHIFGLPAATPILLNIAVITFSVGTVWQYFKSPAIALTVGILVGGALQFLVQVPLLIKKGMRFHFGISFSHPGIRSVGKLMVPAFFGIGIYQINMIMDTMFATSSRMPAGSIASLYVGDRVMELVLGGYAISVATAILPMMSRQAAAGDYEALKKTFAFSLRIVNFITIPAMVGLVILREPIIRVLFQHGEFMTESTRLTARALLYFSFGLPAIAATKLVVPAFYSSHDTGTPVRVAAYTLLINFVLNALFLLFFYRKLQNGGPALATSIAAYFNFAALFIIFRNRFGRLGAREIVRSFIRIIAASTAMGVVCVAMLHFSKFDEIARLLPRVAIFVAMILAAILFYLGAAWLLRCPEMEEVYGIACRRREPAAPTTGLET